MESLPYKGNRNSLVGPKGKMGQARILQQKWEVLLVRLKHGTSLQQKAGGGALERIVIGLEGKWADVGVGKGGGSLSQQSCP